MERVSLRTSFHGEPDNEEEGAKAADQGPDEVTLGVKNGTIKLRVPNSTPDNQVISKEFMDQFLQIVLELEDGSELNVTLDSSSDMADTRLVLASKRAQASEG